MTIQQVLFKIYAHMSFDKYDLHGLVLVKDALDADGGFFIAHALKLLLGLDSNHHVIVIATRNTPSHYAQVMKKLSLNVQQLTSSGRFVVLDALRGGPSLQSFIDLKQISHAIVSAVDASSISNRNLCIIFDDLSVRLFMYCFFSNHFHKVWVESFPHNTPSSRNAYTFPPDTPLW